MFRSVANSRPKLAVLITVLLLAVPSAALAQDADPPSRVARLNFIEGSVSFQPAGESEWLVANPNRPLTTGDQLWAERESRGELHLGGAVLRLSSETAVSFLNLTDQAVQIQVAQGSASLRVRHLEDNESYEIDTPNLALSILRPGKYRVDVSADGSSSTVYVEGGAAEVTAGGQAYNAGPGQQYTFSGTDQVSYDEQPLPQPDSFEEWAVERDRREDRFESSRYVSPDVIGYEDLDDHGRWQDDQRRARLDSERSRGGLGSLPLRALGVRSSLGLDVGGRRALGICAIPLRALGADIKRRLGLGAWTCASSRRRLCATGVCPCAGGVRRRRSDSSRDRAGRPRRSWSGVVSFGPARRLGAFLPSERSLRVEGQRNEFASDQPDGNRKCLQHHSGESDDGGEPHLHVREFAPRGYRCFEKCVSEWRSCR